MTDYDEAAYYEVQLNNKQLVFFFMAAVAIAVVVFLCGVMVGRGVRDAALAAAQTNIAAGVPQTTSRYTPPTTGPGESGRPAEVSPRLDYPERLESEKVPTKLETTPSSSPETTVKGTAATTKPAAPKASGAPPPPAAKVSSVMGANSGRFTIQVVALKTQDAAQSLLSRLQRKNYRAYLEGGDAGLHRVRVGKFTTRAEAEQVARKLRDEEKFKPYITQ